MSTIVEALKKIQTAPSSLARPPEEHPKPARKTDIRKWVLFFALFFLFSAGITGYFLYTRSRAPMSKLPEEALPAFAVTPVATPEEETSKKSDITSYQQKPKNTSFDAFYSPLKLSGIMYLKGKPHAIINNRSLTEGEAIEGFTVLKIKIDSVDVESRDGVNTIRLTQ